MDQAKFQEFSHQCSEGLPNEIDKILKMAKGEKFCAIGLITTDDFYGCYLTWAYSNNIDEYFEWENGAHPDFLYDPLVDIIEADEEIDFWNHPMKSGILRKLCFPYWKKISKRYPMKSFKRTAFSEKISFSLPPWEMETTWKKCWKHP